MKEHETSDLDCWCEPAYEVPCDCDAGCAMCEGGWRRLTRAEAEFSGDAVHVVHRDGVAPLSEPTSEGTGPHREEKK